MIPDVPRKVMPADELRAALIELFPSSMGMGQSDFARLLLEFGHPGGDVARSVRRWCSIGAPPEVAVIVNLLRQHVPQRVIDKASRVPA